MYLTQQSGFLNLLDPGDLILADCGITIEEYIELSKLEMPASTRGRISYLKRKWKCRNSLRELGSMWNESLGF